jgi:ParB-like chromosome segregation protein Spo0J
MLDNLSDLEIVHKKTDSLFEYENNPRINDHAVEKMVMVIKELGFHVPILITEDDEIIDGHLRYKAAKQIGLEEVPTILVTGLDEDRVRALRLELNKSADWAEWDEDLLAIEIGDLAESGLDLALTGFSPSEMDDILGDSEPLDLPTEESSQQEEPPQEPKGDPSAVALTFSMSPEERKAVLTKLSAVREEEGLTTSSEALIFLCT